MACSYEFFVCSFCWWCGNNNRNGRMRSRSRSNSPPGGYNRFKGGNGSTARRGRSSRSRSPPGRQGRRQGRSSSSPRLPTRRRLSRSGSSSRRRRISNASSGGGHRRSGSRSRSPAHRDGALMVLAAISHTTSNPRKILPCLWKSGRIYIPGFSLHFSMVLCFLKFKHERNFRPDFFKEDWKYLKKSTFLHHRYLFMLSCHIKCRISGCRFFRNMEVILLCVIPAKKNSFSNIYKKECLVIGGPYYVRWLEACLLIGPFLIIGTGEYDFKEMEKGIRIFLIFFQV